MYFYDVDDCVYFAQRLHKQGKKITAYCLPAKVNPDTIRMVLMIDPISAFAAVNTAASAISTAIKAGKDLSSLSGPISKYAQAEAPNFGASKEKGIFAKMTGAEQAGIDEFFRKEELATLRDEMRSVFQLYGKPGAWERLQAEIARQRAIQKEELERGGQGAGNHPQCPCRLPDRRRGWWWHHPMDSVDERHTI